MPPKNKVRVRRKVAKSTVVPKKKTVKPKPKPTAKPKPKPKPKKKPVRKRVKRATKAASPEIKRGRAKLMAMLAKMMKL
jgi:protein TonB